MIKATNATEKDEAVCPSEPFPKRPWWLILSVLLWLLWVGFLIWIAWNRSDLEQESAADLPARLKAATITRLQPQPVTHDRS